MNKVMKFYESDLNTADMAHRYYLGCMGHNGPCLCGIGLRSSNKAKEPWKCQEPYYPNLSWFELQTTYNKYSVYRQ